MALRRQPRAGARRAIGLSCVVLAAACSASHGFDGGLDAAEDSGERADASLPPADAGMLDAGPDQAAAFLEFCIRVLQVNCAGVVDCCTIPGRDESECTDSRIRSSCEALAEDPALRDGTLIFREADARRHLAEREAALAVCGARDRRWSFHEVFDGTLEEGEDCTPPEPRRRNYRCRDGLRCELTGTLEDYAGRCTVLGGLGESCNHDCGEGLYCQWTTDANPFLGYCQREDDAASCQSDRACSSMYCRLNVCSELAPADTWCVILG